MSEVPKPLKFVPQTNDDISPVSEEDSSADADAAIKEQMAQHLQLLNSQLVLYARDFRRLVQDQQQKDDELQTVKHQLDHANLQLKLREKQQDSANRSKQTATQTITIIGKSEPLENILNLAKRVAPSMTTVLITGETGTGKELTARYLHQHSKRHDKPFIAVNCGALPESLMESELFGHIKGAFTGADTDKTGLVELAAGGTLMLDEIGELALPLQVKLLRILEERTYRKVGSGVESNADVRIIAATNRNLKQEVHKGQFRADLMYRLNVFPIELPPLRLRSNDIPLLVEHFLTNRQNLDDMPTPIKLSAPAMIALTQYDWPGNIRELRNVLERAALLCDEGIIDPITLGPDFASSSSTMPQNSELPLTSMTTTGTQSVLAQQERSMIEAALQQTGWNKAAAARTLGISWDNLRYRIKKYKLTKPKNM